VDDPRPSSSRGAPRLRDVPDPLLYTLRHSSDEECGDSEEEYTPPVKHRRTKDHSGEFSPSFDLKKYNLASLAY